VRTSGQDTEQIMKYGFPGTHNVRFYDGFVASFDYRTRNACWSCQKIAANSNKDNTQKASRHNSEFKEDPTVPELFRPKLSDYKNSGFDRGHLVPAADLNFHSQKAMDDTFHLTNISPQVAEFNREYWARIEHFTRKLTKQFSNVYVCTGPLYLPVKGPDGKWHVCYQTIGNPPLVAVPTHFYKVILAERDVIDAGQPQKEYAMGAFVVPNSPIPADTPLTQFVAQVEAVELFSGLHFFNKIPRQITQPLCLRTNCVLPPPNFWERSGKGSPNQKLLPPTSVPAQPTKNSSLKLQVDAFSASNAKEVSFPSSLSGEDRRALQQYAQEKGLEYISQTGPNGDSIATLKKK